MHTTVILPYLPPAGDDPLTWVLDGYARQELAPGHTMDVRVGLDGGDPASLAPFRDRAGVLCFAFPRAGAGGTRNALVATTTDATDLLVIGNADARPDPDMVQRHADAMATLPPRSLVLGAAPWERLAPTVIDTLIDETPMIFSYCKLAPRAWADFRAGYSLNLSIRRRDFIEAGGFFEEMRPIFYEDLAFACRVAGPHAKAVWYEPAARVVHRHPMTFPQYLDREEMLGVMAPLLGRVCPPAYEVFFAGRAPATLAEEFRAKNAADPSVMRALYKRLAERLAAPAAALGAGDERRRAITSLYQLHLPVKLLAFRLGFVRGLELVDDARWLERRPAGLWRKILEVA